MSLPVLMLLIFALWTVVALLFSVGIYRWSRILTGRVPITHFRADQVEGEDWYLRAMRAHANCIENLPVFGAIVFAYYVSGLDVHLVEVMSVIVVMARMCQTLIHITLTQTSSVILVRFFFFFTQIICFIAMGLTILLY